MKKIFTIFIGFIHDFAAGCWAASVFAVYWLERQNIAYDLIDIFFDLKRQFFYAGLICIAVVLATGAGRSFTYVGNVYGKDAETMRKVLLVVKHVLLFAVFGAGTWWQYSLVFG